MSERELLNALQAIHAALNQKHTFPADVAYAREIARDTLLAALEDEYPEVN